MHPTPRFDEIAAGCSAFVAIEPQRDPACDAPQQATLRRSIGGVLRHFSAHCTPRLTRMTAL